MKKINSLINPYKNLIAVGIFILLILLSYFTYLDFKKKDEILKTGGYREGLIKCVCSQQAYDEYTLSITEESPEIYSLVNGTKKVIKKPKIKTIYKK